MSRGGWEVDSTSAVLPWLISAGTHALVAGLDAPHMSPSCNCPRRRSLVDSLARTLVRRALCMQAR